MRKVFITALIAAVTVAVFAGCAVSRDDISVVSREEGSGTRGAFVELFGIEEKGADGKKVDNTIVTSEINDSTGIMLTNVAMNKNAIGYVSLGALNDTVKALRIDGANPDVEGIKSGEYKSARPFNIAVKENISEAAKDFIEFIMSSDGQKIVEKNGYIAATAEGKDYKPTVRSGKIVVAGSSSVTPLMEKLREAYLEVNDKMTIEIQQSDSTTGISGAAEGICDIGMASRDLKSSELEKGVFPTAIAIDGIAIIVNSQNETENLSSEQVKGIYTGQITKWSEIKG